MIKPLESMRIPGDFLFHRSYFRSYFFFGNKKRRADNHALHGHPPAGEYRNGQGHPSRTFQCGKGQRANFAVDLESVLFLEVSDSRIGLDPKHAVNY